MFARSFSESNRAVWLVGREQHGVLSAHLRPVSIVQGPAPRPADAVDEEPSRTVVSQCSDLIAMRLTNGDDQAVVRRLLPDSLGGFGDLLPVLDAGEALVVGNAILLPTRIRITQPKNEPLSGTIDFWDRWSDDAVADKLGVAVDAWWRQSMNK